jgi:hypothetical protein
LGDGADSIVHNACDERGVGATVAEHAYDMLDAAGSTRRHHGNRDSVRDVRCEIEVVS